MIHTRLRGVLHLPRRPLIYPISDAIYISLMQLYFYLLGPTDYINTDTHLSLLRLVPSPQSPSPSSSSAVLAQAMAEMQMQMKMQIKGLGGHGQGMTVKGDNTAMGTELMRIPGGMNWSIRKGHSGRPREFECSNFGWCCVSDGRSLSFLLLCFYLFREMDGMI